MQPENISNVFSYFIFAALFTLASASLLGGLEIFQSQISPNVMLISAGILYVAFIASLIVVKKYTH